MQDRATAAGIVSLTLQDMVWVNLLVTGTVQDFDYDKLEKATFRQYNPGEVVDIPGQAEGLLMDFIAAGPFARGNAGTGLVACAAFASLNGHRLAVSPGEAASWVRLVSAGQARAKEKVDAVPSSRPSPWVGVEEAVKAQFRRYRSALAAVDQPAVAAHAHTG